MAQEKWLIQPGETKVIDVDVVRKLKVGLVGGQIDIIGHDEPSARIEVHSVTGRELKVTIDGDALEVDHAQLRWDNFIEVFKTLRNNAKADVSVLVPRDVALKFGIVSAHALVSGLATDAKLSTVSGDLVVDGLTGALELNAVSGELSVRNHTGTISAHTVSGDLTASGGIRKLSSDGVSGNVLLDITGTPDEIATNTVSGNLTVRIPDAVGARYRINTVAGRVQLDSERLGGAPGKSHTGTIGSLDGYWVELSANSVSGDVSVLRSSAQPAGATA
ncbi:MAG: transporter permease [Leifsonia sp.]|nr:transporter permease [Leifsonia sp.]